MTSTDYCKWTTVILTACLSCNSLADVTADEAVRIATINVGSVETSGDYRFTTDSTTGAPLEYESSLGLSVAMGIEDGSGRFMLEYYYADPKIELPPFAVDEGSPRMKTHSIFYSGYWVPDILWGVKGILGAGIGYSHQTLTNAQLAELEDHGWSLKASAGLEYAVIKNLSVYALAEGIFLHDMEDRVDYTAEGSTVEGTADRAVRGNEQVRLALGINLRY